MATAKNSGKGNSPRHEANLLVRRLTEFDRWRAGEAQKDIAKDLKLSKQTISLDIQIAFKHWREQHRGSVNEHVEQELQRLYWVELEAQGEWEESRDPRFLDLVVKCGVERRKLLGLDAPSRTEIKSDVTVSRTFKTREEMFDFVRKGIERHRQQAASDN